MPTLRRIPQTGSTGKTESPTNLPCIAGGNETLACEDCRPCVESTKLHRTRCEYLINAPNLDTNGKH